MEISDIENTARQKLEDIKNEKAAIRSKEAKELLALQENHIRVYGKYERNRALLEKRLVLSDNIDSLIIRFGVEGVSELNDFSGEKILEYKSNRIPIKTNDDSIELFAVAWKTVPRRGNVSILRRSVSLSSPLPSSDKNLEAGLSLYAEDNETGDTADIKRFGIFNLSVVRNILKADDMDTIADYVNDEQATQSYYTELEQVIGLIDQPNQLPVPIVS